MNVAQPCKSQNTTKKDGNEHFIPGGGCEEGGGGKEQGGQGRRLRLEVRRVRKVRRVRRVITLIMNTMITKSC